MPLPRKYLRHFPEDLLSSIVVLIYHFETNHLGWEGVGLFLIEDGLIREWQDFTMRVQRVKP